MTHATTGLAQQYVLQAVLESPKDIVIIALDREYRYLAFNEAHRRVMKQIWNADIRIGQNMLETVRRDDDRERAKHNFDRALAGEHFMRTEEFGDEALSRRYYEDVYSPIVDAQGCVVGLTIYLTDVTEQTRARQRLEQYQRDLERSIQERTAALRRNQEIHQKLVQNAPISAMLHRGHEILLAGDACLP
ncbi:MAG: PAS domain S-box protein, partial [Proteobacteria bacterium]